MKNRSVHFMGIALSGLLLFGCATGNKYSKVSYGGAWAEDAKKSTAVTTSKPAEKATPAQITPTETSSVATVAESPARSESTPSVSSVAGKDQVSAPLTKRGAEKQTLKQKVAKRLVQKISNQKNSNEIDNKLVLVIIAIFLPWLAVYLYEGEITMNFWLTLLLWFLFYLPGFIYALLVIFDVI